MTTEKDPMRLILMGVMLGLLTATAPTWLNPNHKTIPHYDAPWIHPSQVTTH